MNQPLDSERWMVPDFTMGQDRIHKHRGSETDPLDLHNSDTKAANSAGHGEANRLSLRGDSTLPPKQLGLCSAERLCKRHIGPWVLVFLIIITVLLLFSIIHDCSALYSTAAGPVCPAQVDSNDPRRWFQINARVAENLSFTSAKLIDLAWDTVVGQGGRLLHGLLMCDLAGRALTLIMESSSIPYSLYLPLTFSTVSLEALFASIRFIFSKAPLKSILVIVWFFFAVLYTLAFPTIWSAATAYDSPGAPAYQIHNGSYVRADSALLTLCWSLTGSQSLPSGLEKVVTGPSFQEAFGNRHAVGDEQEFDRLDLATNTSTGLASEAFRNLYSYALSKKTIQDYLGHYADSIPTINRTNTYGTISWLDTYNSSSNTPTGYSFAPNEISNSLVDTITGWQYAGYGQNSTDHSLNYLGSDYNPYEVVFAFNDSALHHGIPYNSSIWWKNASMQLPAPFLQFDSSCQWIKNPLGACLCFDGIPINADFRHLPSTCVNSDGYLWGFAGTLTFAGLLLETIWVASCGIMWMFINLKSELVRARRSGTGTLRGVLDVSGAISADLGNSTGAYSSKELDKKLAEFPPIGYSLEEDEGRNRKNIRLRGVIGGYEYRGALGVDQQTLYG